MILHIFIAGRERYCWDIAPGQVQEALALLDLGLNELSTRGRITVALDSARHPNVTYILNRGQR